MRAIDTHAIIKELVASGTTEKQAEIFVSTFVSKDELASLDKESLDLVTSSDLKVATSELKGEIKELKTDIKWIMALLVGIFGLLIKSTFFK